MDTNYNKSWNGQINNLADFINYIPICQKSDVDDTIKEKISLIENNLADLLSHNDIFQKLSVEPNDSSVIVDGNLNCEAIKIGNTTLNEEMLINLLESETSIVVLTQSEYNLLLNNDEISETTVYFIIKENNIQSNINNDESDANVDLDDNIE